MAVDKNDISKLGQDTLTYFCEDITVVVEIWDNEGGYSIVRNHLGSITQYY